MTGGRSVASQVGAAAVLALAVVAAVLFVGGQDDSAVRNGKPGVCAPPKDTDAPGYPALCAALNRPDLPELVGAPGARVVSAYSAGVLPSGQGGKGRDAAAEVQLGSYYVRLSDNGDLPVRDFAGLVVPKAVPGSVLGHPAVTYADHTMSIAFSLTGSKASAGTGGIARHLVVAKGPQEDGGSYEIAVWRQDDATPDDEVVRRVAEAVLPTLQEWVLAPS